MTKLPTDAQIREVEDVFRPYIFALGQVAHAWNHLQETLASLFCVVAGINQTIGLAIWHSLQSDRAQREMLRAALAVRALDEDWSKKNPDAKASVSFILEEVNKLADRRNDAVHAPCSVGIHEGEFEVIPLSFWGNPRARKLKGKAILTEFSWYEACADSLRSYTHAVEAALDGGPWPDKPQMPTLELPPSRKGKHHRSDAK
jgi:hypothetical protein